MEESAKVAKGKYKKLPLKEVVAILKDKYHVPQPDIDYLDAEFKRRLLKDLQNSPMLND